MTTSRTITVSIACPAPAAYAFMAEPTNLPRWASGLGSTVTRTDGGWRVETPAGPAIVVFAPPNPDGVLDHTVTLASGDVVHVPLRVVPRGNGCDVVFTLFRQPGMDDAAFAADAAWVERDLAALKALLESRG